MCTKCKYRTTRYFGKKKSCNGKDATCWYSGKGSQPSTIVGFQRNPGMVRIKITARKKRVTWLDQIQAEASRPRASYTPSQLDEAGIVKFINKEAAKQRRAQVNRMVGVAFGQQALRSYMAAQKKQRRRASRHPPFARNYLSCLQKISSNGMDLRTTYSGFWPCIWKFGLINFAKKRLP